jgi:hypothetical protein
MPKPLQFPTKVLIAFDDQRLDAIDEWRRRQSDLPNRSEAIRRLVDVALGAPRRRGVAGSPMTGRPPFDEKTSRAKKR